MPFETVNTRKLASKYGIDLETIDAKHALINKIKTARLKQGLSQNDLALRINKSQSFIAKVESGIGTKNFSFDLLLLILKSLGYEFKIMTRKSTSDSKLAA